MTLVAKRWRAAFYAERSLWRRLAIGLPFSLAPSLGSDVEPPQAVALRCNCVEHLLRCVGGVVEAADVQCNQLVTDEQLARLLQHLAPGTLKALRVSRFRMPWDELDAACEQQLLPAADALERFPGLHTLRIACGHLPLFAEEAIGSMQQLSRLELDTPCLPLAVARAVAQLTQLTQLQLGAEEMPAAPAGLLALRRLSHLQVLHVELHSHTFTPDGPSVLLPPPMCFPHLRRHRLIGCRVSCTHAGLAHGWAC